MSKHLEVDRDLFGGVPVIRGTRMTAAQLLTIIAEDDALAQIAYDFGYKEQYQHMKGFLEDLSRKLDIPLRAVREETEK